MNLSQTRQQDCGSETCGCGQAPLTHAASSPAARINGVALLAPGQTLDPEELRETAYTELLRQQAVKAGLLPHTPAEVAPTVSDAERLILENMVEAAVQVPTPTLDECQRYYDARKSHFVVGQAVHLRHILFAVTPGVNVHALTVHAEKALISLLGKNVAVDAFAKTAAQMSNCPSRTRGGDLGWIGPNDCAPELANELFHQSDSLSGQGVHPRLIHTRFGFHIIEVLGRRKGKVLPFEEVQKPVAARLAMQSRAKAWHQYMSLLAGQAQVEGVVLDTADSPLVQ